MGLEAPDDDPIPSQAETGTNEQEENLVSERRYPLFVRLKVTMITYSGWGSTQNQLGADPD